jgi:flagellin-like hook-associated protein FlgL
MEAANQFLKPNHSIVNAMQLTNFSFLNSRMDYLDSKANFKSAVQRISSGSKMEGLRKDVGAYSQRVNARLNQLHNNSYKTNLQNTRSFLEVQEQGLRQVLDIYDRMDVLAVKALDPTANPSDRKLYDQEFKSLSNQLSEIMKRKFNGEKLFNDTLVCGGSKDIPLGQLDLVGGKPDGVDHAVRSQSVDVNAPGGTVTFRVNSGRQGDTYRVWMGDINVLSLGAAFEGPSNTHDQQFDDPGFNYARSGWRTSEGARGEDDDLITVTFAPGEKTTYTITPGNSNDNNSSVDRNTENLWDGSNWLAPVAGDGISDFNQFDLTTGKYVTQAGLHGSSSRGNTTDSRGTGVVITNDLPADFESTTLTIQLETESIGIIYSKGDSANGDADNSGTPGVTFVPANYEKPVTVNANGDKIFLDPKGFGVLDGESPVTGELHTLSVYNGAKDTLDHLRGNPYANDSSKSYYGEEKCVVSERLASVGAEMSRIDKALESLERKAITDELTISRIEDADVAQEATNLATASIKTQMSAQVMSKSTRLKDILIPLTTDHFRSSVLSAKL